MQKEIAFRLELGKVCLVPSPFSIFLQLLKGLPQKIWSLPFCWDQKTRYASTPDASYCVIITRIVSVFSPYLCPINICRQHTATPYRKGDWPDSYILLSLSAGFTAKRMMVSLFLAPSQIMFLWPFPTKQEKLLFALHGPFIFYCDTVLKIITLLSLGFICTFLTTYCKVRQFSPHALPCAFWHSSWWSARALYNSVWFTYALLLQISCLTQFLILYHLQGVHTFCSS